MSDVFFSYKREDRAAVERLVRLLEAENIAVWWDPSIGPGERYAAVIRRELDQACCVAVGWSQRSVDSMWVQDEAGIGRDRGVLIPVSLDGVDPPLGFRQLQTLDLAGWNGQPDDPRIVRFLGGVRRLIAEQAAAGSRKLSALAVEDTPGLAIPQGKSTKVPLIRRPRMAVFAALSVAMLLLAGALLFVVERFGSSVDPQFTSAIPRPDYRPGSRDCMGCPDMVVAPTGSFMMGSWDREPQRGSDEGPQHEVTFSKPFAAGKYPVMVEDWEFCVAQGGCVNWPSVAKFGRGSLPAINVSWEDAQTYVAWLSSFTGKAYRLLSEAEREYITRAGTSTPFWWGPSISSELSNYDGRQRYTDEPKGQFRKKTVAVDLFGPNPWGFYDVHGNSWDWVEDCYHDTYDGAPSDGSAWTTGDCNRRVLRGGGWESQPRNLRSAARYRLAPVSRGDWYGFRLGRACDTAQCRF
jgi:formylglycine-generating enzyme required for sulfatase activity